jgi:hypothetical protein
MTIVAGPLYAVIRPVGCAACPDSSAGYIEAIIPAGHSIQKKTAAKQRLSINRQNPLTNSLPLVFILVTHKQQGFGIPPSAVDAPCI